MVIMGWPVAADYDESIQNPHLNFIDPELRAGEIVYDQYGSPEVRCGNFASVYLIKTPQRKVAVRCFLREIKDQQERYGAISHDLLSLGLPYTVPFEFVEKGLKVQGSWFPILKMDWCDGELLDAYLLRNLNDPVKLRRLSDKWFEMSVVLRKEGIAHGDLQHGNVFVQDDELKLIDYDGMFVPRLAGRQSNERGLDHYQHPKRTDQHFGRYLDNFANWAIYTSIFALSADPSLWNLVNLEDKHLIFKKQDFENPDESETFKLLKKHDDRTVRTYATTVENLLAYDVPKVPEFHPDKPVLYPPSAQSTIPKSASSDTADRGRLFEEPSGDRGKVVEGGGDRGNQFAPDGDRGRLLETAEDKTQLATVDAKTDVTTTDAAKAQATTPQFAKVVYAITAVVVIVGVFIFGPSMFKGQDANQELQDKLSSAFKSGDSKTIGDVANDTKAPSRLRAQAFTLQGLKMVSDAQNSKDPYPDLNTAYEDFSEAVKADSTYATASFARARVGLMLKSPNYKDVRADLDQASKDFSLQEDPHFREAKSMADSK